MHNKFIIEYIIYFFNNNNMGNTCTQVNTINFTEDFRPPYIYRNDALKYREMEVYEHTIDP